MNDVLQPITVYPILRPVYDNTKLHSFGEWLAVNRQAIDDYYAALNTQGAGPPDLFEFEVIQHETQLILSRQPTLSQLEPCETV